MTENKNQKNYDLEIRTRKFAKDCRVFISKIPKTVANIEDRKQLARASGSVAANYIEANESLSTKDYYYRVKVCRKEIKECGLWLDLIDPGSDLETIEMNKDLIQESIELMRIFGSIITTGSSDYSVGKLD